MINDKMKHLMAGLVIAVVVALPCYFETGNLFAGLWATLAGVIVGLLKEWYDYSNDGRFDWRDLGCTVLGVVCVCGFIILLHVGKG